MIAGYTALLALFVLAGWVAWSNLPGAVADANLISVMSANGPVTLRGSL